jgi:hypothetical protein
MMKNKFKVGDLVKWNPSKYDLQKGELEDKGVVIEIGEFARWSDAPLKRYALVNWIGIGLARVVLDDSSWSKTELLARGQK